MYGLTDVVRREHRVSAGFDEVAENSRAGLGQVVHLTGANQSAGPVGRKWPFS